MRWLAPFVLTLAVAGTAAAQQPPQRMAPPPAVGAEVPARPVYLTDEEIKATIAMLDECVKAKGLACAEPALVIRQKLLAPLAQDPKK